MLKIEITGKEMTLDVLWEWKHTQTLMQAGISGTPVTFDGLTYYRVMNRNIEQVDEEPMVFFTLRYIRTMPPHDVSPGGGGIPGTIYVNLFEVEK